MQLLCIVYSEFKDFSWRNYLVCMQTMEKAKQASRLSKVTQYILWHPDNVPTPKPTISNTGSRYTAQNHPYLPALAWAGSRGCAGAGKQEKEPAPVTLTLERRCISAVCDTAPRITWKREKMCLTSQAASWWQRNGMDGHGQHMFLYIQ